MSTNYLDKICFRSIFIILFKKKYRIRFLENKSNINLYWVSFFKFLNYDIDELKFHAGDFISTIGEAVPITATRIASELSIEISEYIFRNSYFLDKFNRKLKRDGAKLFAAKALNNYIRKYVLNFLVIEQYYESKLDYIFFAKPVLVPLNVLNQRFTHLNIFYYIDYFEVFLNFIKKLKIFVGLFVFSLIRHFSSFLFSSNIIPNQPGVFSLQEDSIRLNNALRSQLHWIQNRNSLEFNYFILLNKFNLVENNIENKLNQNNIYLIKKFNFLSFKLNSNFKYQIGLIYELRKIIIRGLFEFKNISHFSLLLHFFYLVEESYSLANLFISLNIKVFLNSENYTEKSQAAIIACEALGIKSISYQYSNLGFMSVPMMTTADIFILFGYHYKELFQKNLISPGEFREGGYCREIDVETLERAKEIRRNLLKKGSKFIIAYFDESIEYTKFGLVSNRHHLVDTLRLAKEVLQFPNIAIIIKTQFMFNLPSKLYFKSKTIKKAFDTGRFLELSEGNHRNDILPSEVAMASDLVINHKFGATAALESALCGKPVVLLNNYKLNSITDKYYKKNKVLFESIDVILKSVRNNNDIGNWDNILSKILTGHKNRKKYMYKIYDVVWEQINNI